MDQCINILFIIIVVEFKMGCNFVVVVISCCQYYLHVVHFSVLQDSSMVYSAYRKQWIVFYHFNWLKSPKQANALKLMRYDWAVENQHDTFDNVIYTDECSVLLETHKRFCWQKEGEAPRL